LDPTDILLDGDDYFATQTTGSGCESTTRVEVNVIINDTPTPTLASEGDEFCISDRPTLLELTANILEYDSNTNNITWYDSETGGTVLSSSTLLEHETYYYATLFDPSTGCESRYRLPVMADLTACGALVFPDGFSPNGDGVNDRYEVENMAFLYPDFVLEIYNRYGNLVYKGNASTPLFDGTSNQSRLVTKGDLPVGVYFYIANFNDGTKSKQGRLYLSR
jgi:gliding motility-associated-like protein